MNAVDVQDSVSACSRANGRKKARRTAAVAAATLATLTALSLSGCQVPGVTGSNTGDDHVSGEGADNAASTNAQGGATPAPSPAASNPAGEVIELPNDLKAPTDLESIGDVIAVRDGATLAVGTAADFKVNKAVRVGIDSTCGELTPSADDFVLACGDSVLLIDPHAPDKPDRVDTDEEFSVTSAVRLSSGELFVASSDSARVSSYIDGKRKKTFDVEAGSTQLLAVPNGDRDDGLVRTQRSDTTIQSIDWTKDRAGGRLRVGQGLGTMSAGANGTIVVSDTLGKRIAIYTDTDVVRLHQYGIVQGTPWATAWDDSRKLAWTATTDNNLAQAFDVKTGVPVPQGSVPTVANAQHMTVLEDGTLVLASASGDGLQVISKPELK